MRCVRFKQSFHLIRVQVEVEILRDLSEGKTEISGNSTGSGMKDDNGNARQGILIQFRLSDLNRKTT